MVLTGCLLTTFNNVGWGWVSTLVTIVGFIVFIIGLNNFKKELDQPGQSAIRLLFIAAILGLAGAAIAWIPIIGLLSMILLLAAFVIQIIGYVKLKGSETIGKEGASGATLLLVSMIVLVAGGLFGIIPVIGRFAGPLFAIGGLALIVFGWLKVQKGFIGETQIDVQSVSYILAGALMQLGSSAVSGWAASLTSVFGFILFFMGLNGFKNTVDEVGKKAVQVILIAVFIGIGASVVDFIAAVTKPTPSVFEAFAAPAKPTIFDTIASVVFIVAFVVKLIGFIMLKGSEMLGEKGKSGVTLLIVSMGLAVLTSVFIGLLPIGGGIVSGLLSIASLLLVVFGWLKIQEALAEKV